MLWNDGTKTVVKCQPGDSYDKEKGLMAAMLKRSMGNDNTYNKVLKKWLPPVRDCSTCKFEAVEPRAIDNPCWNCKGNGSEYQPK